MSSLLDQLNQDLIEAQKAKDAVGVSTLRFLISGLHNAKIAKGGELTDEELVSGISKEAKAHKESIEAYERGGRSDLVEKEKAELEVLTKYLPQALSDEELERMVAEAIGVVGAKTPADFGRVMAAVLSSTGARADGATVAAIVKRKLGV